MTRSITRSLTRRLADAWSARVPDGTIVERDLGTAPPPAVDEPWITAAFADPPQPDAAALRPSETLIAELEAADAVVLGTVGQSAPLLEPIGLLAPRQPSRGPIGLPVSKTAEEASVADPASAPDWRLEITGPEPYWLSLAEVEALPAAEEDLPFPANEGWSARARWRGPRLLELVRRAGGTESSVVRVFSLEPRGPFNKSTVEGSQLARAVLATHLNGERLSADHGYPLRLIVPNRAGLFNTKWITRVEVLS